MSTPDDIRITDLEIHAAHQNKVVEDLSDIVARQATEIEALTRRVKMLMERAAGDEAEGGATAPLADQAPPHY